MSVHSSTFHASSCLLRITLESVICVVSFLVLIFSNLFIISLDLLSRDLFMERPVSCNHADGLWIDKKDRAVISQFCQLNDCDCKDSQGSATAD